MWNASRFCVSSLRRGHANLLCIVPILVYVLPKQEPPFNLMLTSILLDTQNNEKQFICPLKFSLQLTASCNKGPNTNNFPLVCLKCFSQIHSHFYLILFVPTSDHGVAIFEFEIKISFFFYRFIIFIWKVCTFVVLFQLFFISFVFVFA